MMGYRRTGDHEAQRPRAEWLRANRPALERIGLPLAVYCDWDHGYDFLQNGCLEWHTDGPPFDFAGMPSGQMRQLRALLEANYSEDPPPLLRWLRARLV